ncbi:MAG: hypothetical protein KAH15_01860 [Candidatus Marinimicrobia bacterium]|nr:hypothetical protein [Candidatus Neomarinimicrobiota bacterium]
MAYIIILISLTLFSFSWGRNDIQQDNYRKAIVFEKIGEYSKAESLYVDLYSDNPDNFNYFTRYKNMLIQQRKFELLLPVIEERVGKRQFDKYIKLELAVLYYTLGKQLDAKKIYRSIFNKQSKSMWNSYANNVYYDMIEYGQGSNCYQVINTLRDITGNRELLVRYSFITSLRYRNWDDAVKEIIVILESNPTNLRYVRSDLFRYDPLSALYQHVINELSEVDNTQGKELLSEIYIHLSDYKAAFNVLSRDKSDKSMHKAMLKFANRMFKRSEFDISHQAAKWTEENISNENNKIAMALLAARSREQMFYKLIQEPKLVFIPYASVFTDIKFKSFNSEEATMIESAYLDYDSLSVFPGIYGQMARMRHAGISYRIYQDFDKALEEYLVLADNINMGLLRDVLSGISELYMAKGEYEKAVTFIEHAGTKYRLMVHEEDQLLPQSFLATIIAGNLDSLTQRAMNVLAMLPKDDPLYNDVLSFTGFINIVAQDTLYHVSWLEGERYLLKNNLAQAQEIFKELLDKDSPAKAIYALRYLDCINTLNDKDAESLFWDKYYQILLRTDMADYFMIQYAVYHEKMQKYEIASEIFEKYLLSYQESMYYERIREYIRQHYSTGTP